VRRAGARRCIETRVIVAVAAVVSVASAFAAAPACARPLPTTLVVPPDQHTLGIHRVTDLHLKLFTGLGNRFRDPQGLACVKLVAQDDPKTKSDDDELTVYGVNSGDASIIYNDSMTSVKIWRGAMRRPRGIAADASGRVVVADTGNDRLLLLRNVAGRLSLDRAIGRRGAAPGEFVAPAAVALDSRGRIYVADSGNDRVQVLDPLGGPLTAFGAAGEGPGRLVGPSAVAVVDRKEPWSYHARDLVIVVDRGGRRIQAFTPTGTLAHAFEDSASAGRSFAHIALDYYDNVYATDTRRSQIRKFDATLRPIASFGERGEGDAQFIGPTGIAIWRRFGQVFVAESTGAQYYWVGADIENFFALPAEVAPGAAAILAYSLTEQSLVDIDLLDRSGELLSPLVRGAFQEPGRRRAPCPAVDSTGAPLPPARYRIRLRATPTYSSKKSFRREMECALDVVAPVGARVGKPP